MTIPIKSFYSFLVQNRESKVLNFVIHFCVDLRNFKTTEDFLGIFFEKCVGKIFVIF